MSYPIIQDYIPFGQSRSGQKILSPRYGVAHDTGNSGSTARGNVNWFKGNPVEASAHTFIDHIEIIEDIPLWEKAWHVRYNVTADNRIYGDDADDCAIGVELCYGGSIDFEESYKRYVWYFAYLCKKFGWNPKTDIVGHSKLDPGRKTDPENALHRNGKTFNDFILDIRNELNEDPMDDGFIELGEKGKVIEVLQKELNVLMGIGLVIDGSYGPKTEAAVKRFQEQQGLKVDGYYGPASQQAVDEALTVHIQSKEEAKMAKNLKETGFKDVPPEHSLATEVRKAKKVGVTEGYGDGTFKPDQTMTRAEGVAFVVRGIEHVTGKEIKLDD